MFCFCWIVFEESVLVFGLFGLVWFGFWFVFVSLFQTIVFFHSVTDFPRMRLRSGSFFHLLSKIHNKKKVFLYIGILACCFLVCVPLENLRAKVDRCGHKQNGFVVTANSVFQDVKCRALGPLQLFWRSLKRVYRVNGNTNVVLLPRDGISEKKAVFINSRLAFIRNYKLKKLIQRNLNTSAIQRALKYIRAANETLNHFDAVKLKERFDSLENRKSSHLCDGCFLKRSVYFPEKPYVNGELYRKFVGGVETDVIYNVSHRSPSCGFSRVATYAPANSSFDVTAIYALYGLNRMFTIRELLYRYRGYEWRASLTAAR